MYFIFIYIQFSLACPLDNCETCISDPYPMCINCLSGYKRDLLSGCLQTPNSSIVSNIENCIAHSITNNCLTCSKDYNLFQGRCFPQCPKNCLCFYPNTCLQNSRNTEACEDDERCISCHKETCLTCKDNYTLGMNGRCLICEIENCDKCLIDNICGKCNNNYGLKDEICVKCQDPNCRECNNNEICEKCLNGYTLTDNKCEIGCLDTNCKQCSDSANICDACADGYKLENGFCCPLNCKSCNSTKGTCYYCDNEYVLDQGSNQCVSCPENCKTCSSSKKCTKCLSGFELDGDGKCRQTYAGSNVISIIVPVIGGVVLIM